MISEAYPQETEHTLNVDKTCRRRLGRFLNLLCTFDLRPVSMEFALVKIIDQKKPFARFSILDIYGGPSYASAYCYSFYS